MRREHSDAEIVRTAQAFERSRRPEPNHAVIPAALLAALLGTVACAHLAKAGVIRG